MAPLIECCAPSHPIKIAVTGPSVPLETGVRVRTDVGLADFDLSDRGTLVYVSAEDEMHVPVLVDRKGAESPIAVEPGSYTFPRFSHSGDRFVIGNRVRDLDLWMWEFARPGLRPLIRNIGLASEAVWTTGDSAVLFPFRTKGRRTIARLNADGSGQPSIVGENQQGIMPHAVAPDGSLIVRHQQDIATLKSDRQPPLQVLIRNAANATLSPDGRWLAYESSVSGRRQVIVRPFPEIERGEWQISGDRGYQPAWSRAGSEVFYQSAEGMMSVAIRADASFRFDPPRLLFKTAGYMRLGLGRHFDVGPKDTFVLLKRVGGSKPPVVKLVVNFADDVAARVKAK
jgi:Tol biopolymer transport system component